MIKKYINECKISYDKKDKNLFEIKYNFENNPLIKIIDYSITIEEK